MKSDLIDRLRGIYRIPITDGLGAVGSGDEPDNPNEFVRSFPTTPIHKEAAEAIEECIAFSNELFLKFRSLEFAALALKTEWKNHVAPVDIYAALKETDEGWVKFDPEMVEELFLSLDEIDKLCRQGVKPPS
jgi:hypothetical protein